MQRDNATKEQVLQRMKNQWMEEDKVKMSDYIIINDGSHQLIPQVMKLNEKLRQKDK
jgi:dephospho-CoA kinase